MRQWIKCAERMPAVGVQVIGHDRFYGRVGTCVRASWGPGRLIFVDGQKDDCSIDKWMDVSEYTVDGDDEP